ncbi:alpha/beta hydrolase, partial [archaeon]
MAAANAGIVGAVCNYRLAPDVKHPDNAVDVARALVWLRDNVRQYGGDPDAIFLCGHSAGAHLAMHVAVTGARTLLREAGMHSGGDAPSAPSTSPDVDEVEIAGVIGLCGVYNVSRLGKSPFGESLVHPVFSADPAVWRRASPVYNVPSHSSLHRTPVLLLNAEHDFHLEEDAEELELALAVHAPPHTKHWFQERRAGVASALQACVPPLPAIAHHRAGRSASTEARAASVYDGMLDSAEHDGAPLSEPAPELGTGVRWAPGPGLSPNVFRGVIAGTNHMTLVGGMG